MQYRPRTIGLLTAIMMAHYVWPVSRAEAQAPIGTGLDRPSSYQLNWQSPPGCPGGADVSREILELTAASTGPKLAVPVMATATVINDAAGFVLTLTLRDAQVARSRRIAAPTCAELGHAAALIVALAIDPTLFDQRAASGASDPSVSREGNGQNAYHCRLVDLPQPQPAPPPVVIDRPCPPNAVVTPSQPQNQDKANPGSAESLTRNTTTSEPLFLRLGLGLFGTYRTLPGPAFGVNVLAGIAGRHSRLDVIGSLLSGAVQTSVAGRSADLVLYRLAARGCWLVANSPSWAVGPCVGTEAGLLSGIGYGPGLTTREQYALWLASSLGALAELRLTASARLLLSMELNVPWLRGDGFQLAGETVQKTRISGSFGTGLTVGWP